MKKQGIPTNLPPKENYELEEVFDPDFIHQLSEEF